MGAGEAGTGGVGIAVGMTKETADEFDMVLCLLVAVVGIVDVLLVGLVSC